MTEDELLLDSKIHVLAQRVARLEQHADLPPLFNVGDRVRYGICVTTVEKVCSENSACFCRLPDYNGVERMAWIDPRNLKLTTEELTVAAPTEMLGGLPPIFYPGGAALLEELHRRGYLVHQLDEHQYGREKVRVMLTTKNGTEMTVSARGVKELLADLPGRRSSGGDG